MEQPSAEVVTRCNPFNECSGSAEVIVKQRIISDGTHSGDGCVTSWTLAQNTLFPICSIGAIAQFLQASTLFTQIIGSLVVH